MSDYGAKVDEEEVEVDGRTFQCAVFEHRNAQPATLSETVSWVADEWPFVLRMSSTIRYTEPVFLHGGIPET